MIEFKSGDLFNEEAEAIVNTVNCVGVMGRGIALQFKKRYPDNFDAYAKACTRKQVLPGRMFVFETYELHNPKYIINFPTKRHWRAKSRLEDIQSGLKALVDVIREYKIRSIAMPPLGSGLGGLDWPVVKSLIEKRLACLDDVCVMVFEPKGAPASEKMKHTREAPAMTPGRAALIELMHRYLEAMLDPFITLLELHKLMYFLQEAGEDLKLEYTKAPYGPYAENLRHVLNRIEGHFVSGYADGGDAPDKQLKLAPGAVQAAQEFLSSHIDVCEYFKKVSNLVDGFETPFGLELLSTVHWVISKEAAHSMKDVIHRTYSWNERKRQFTERQIILAADILAQKGWVDRIR